MSESLKSAHKRLTALETRIEDIHSMTVAIATLNTKVDDLGCNVEEIKSEVKKTAERPAVWWDKLIAALLGAIGSGLMAALLSQVLR